MKVTFIYCLWNCNARFAKMARFTQMKICNNQRILFFPKQRALRQNMKCIAINTIPNH